MATHDPNEELLGSILSRAASDPDFRRALLSDPVPAIRDAFGVQLPHGYRLRFIERDPDLDALVVLPPAAPAAPAAPAHGAATGHPNHRRPPPPPNPGGER